MHTLLQHNNGGSLSRKSHGVGGGAGSGGECGVLELQNIIGWGKYLWQAERH